MKRPSRPRARRQRSRWLWLCLGLITAAVAATLLGRPPVRRETRPPRDPESDDDGRAPAEIFSLPEDARAFWVPGPSGSLRIVERHAKADLTLLFVHGLGGRLEHWAGQLSSIGPSLAGLAVDLPGHGGSDGFGEADALEAAAGAVGAALDGSRVRRPLIVAHGWGCLAVLRWAARNPGRPRGLLLIDPPADQSRMRESDVKAFTQAVRADARAELNFFVRQSLADVPAALGERIAADVQETPDGVLEACLLASSRATPARDAEAAQTPVHVATSDLGRLPQSIDSLVPAVTAWHLPGGSHWCMVARPAQLNQLIDDVLDSLRAVPGIV